MMQAARALDRLGSGATADGSDETVGARRSRLAIVESAQANAVEELRQVLSWMGQWGDFQAMVAKIRALLDRQQQMRADALSLGGKTAGKPVDALTDLQQIDLNRLVRDQGQLARDLEQWLQTARLLVERLREKDPSTAEALESAVRAALAQRVLPRIEKAADALAANRTAAASIEQRAVESGLGQVLDALEARQVRELAELRRNAERLLDAVAGILHEQEALRDATGEIIPRRDAGGAFADLADQQRRLRRNTEQLTEDMRRSPESVTAAGELTNAVAPMERAESRLRETAGRDASASQAVAVAALQRTVELLERLIAEADHRLMQQSLTRTRRQLEKIRDRQGEINARSEGLVTEMQALGRLTRLVARRATRLAQDQAEVREQTITLRGDLADAAVYSWVLDRVMQRMESARDALAGRRLDEKLVEDQRTVLRELSSLIDAIASIESLPPPDDFVDEAGGAGGGGDAGEQPPVPPVAELLVIRSMQQTLNQRTQALHAQLADDEPTEALLGRARDLGQEQERLRALTERVTRGARGGP
jgi:hypothetical protein